MIHISNKNSFREKISRLVDDILGASPADQNTSKNIPVFHPSLFAAVALNSQAISTSPFLSVENLFISLSVKSRQIEIQRGNRTGTR